jgi:thioredoxin-related protein
MKLNKSLLVLTAIFFIFIQTLSAQTDADDIYYQGSFEDLQKEALETDRPYFVYFYRNGCPACAEMEESTFPNKWLKMYVKARYLPAFKVQAFSLYSDYLTKRYGVTSFPQILLFSPKGKILKRIDHKVSAKQLIEEMRLHEKEKGLPDFDMTVFEEDADPELSMKLQTEAVFTGLYKFSIRPEEAKAETLGVQIGVFSDYKNMVASVLELDQNWHDNILVATYEVEGKTYFRLLFGTFYSIEHAKSYQRSLKNKYGLHGIIIKLDDFSPYTEAQSEVFSVDKKQTENTVNEDYNNTQNDYNQYDSGDY